MPLPTREEVLEYLKLVPQAVQDPAYYQLLFGINPETAASQDITGQNDLVKMGAGALQGVANIGNTVGNVIDPLARAAEGYFGPVTLGGAFPTVDQAAQTRQQGLSNFNALYGGSIPAAVGREMGLEALGGPLLRATGNAIPYIGAGVNRLMQGGVAQRVAGNALTGAGYGTGLAALGSSGLEGDFADSLIGSAIGGAGFGALNAARGPQPPFMNMSGGAKPSAEPVAPRQGKAAVYSKLEDTVIKGEGAPKTAPPDKWLQYLNGAQARGLMSKEERADIGIDDWLEEKAELGQPVTRQELQQFVAENTPRFKTVVPGGGVDSHALFEIQQLADSDAQRAGVESLITSINNGYLEGYAELPAMQELVEFYGGDTNRLAMDADLITSRAGIALANGLEPSPDDLARARQFYDAFTLAQDVDGATPPSLSFEQFLAEAGKEGADAYNVAFKKAFPDLWANTYYDNALDAMQRQVDNPTTQRQMGELFKQQSRDNVGFSMFKDSLNDHQKFNRLFGDQLGKPLESDAELGALVDRTGLINAADMPEAEDLLFHHLGSGAVANVRNRVRDQALEDVANRFLKEKPRYEYYQWDKGNARDYHERILQLQTPYDTPESRQAKVKELGFTATEQTERFGPNVYAIKTPDGRYAATGSGSSPDDALNYWAGSPESLEFFRTEKPYTHSHWDEENPIAHWRANVRDNLVDDGVPSYHIEEIQSDWHQQAGTAAREMAEEGYTGYRPKPGSRAQKDYDKKVDELNKLELETTKTWNAWDKQQDEVDRLASIINAGGGTDADVKAYENANIELNRLEVIRNETRDQARAAREAMPPSRYSPYPDAPFKNSWEQLVLKNALKEAVDRDLTRVSWTPGELQSTATGQAKNAKGNDERYNKRVVNYMNDIGKKYGTKVQFKSTADTRLTELGLKPVEYVKPGPIKGDGLFLIVDNPVYGVSAPLGRGKYIIAPKRDEGSSLRQEHEALYRFVGDVKKQVGDEEYNKIRNTSYESIEAAEQAVKGMLDKLPKIPYMNLTPRLIEDIKAGKLSMY